MIATVVVAGVGWSSPVTSAARSTAHPPPASSVPSASPAGRIKHIVLIDQENRSFDEVLGAFCVQHARCDGYIGSVKLSDGSIVPMTKSPDMVSPDPSHTIDTLTRVVDGGKMDGWNKIDSCKKNGVNLCLTYYTPDQIPGMTAYANYYVVSDRTFSMYNSPSWGGHIYAVAATQDGFVGDIPRSIKTPPPGPGWGCDSNRIGLWVDSTTGVRSLQPSCIPAPPGQLDAAKYPYAGAFRATKVPNVPTIMDRLDAAGLPWRIYASIYIWSVCPNFATCLYTPQRQKMVAPAQILADARNGTLPAFSLLLPSGPNGTGQHPPNSMLLGDNWLTKVIFAIQSSPNWSSTAIFITYDDCGCFYDHVPPGVNPDGTKQGVREPMIIISPYAKHAYTDSTNATLSSVLRFTEEAFGLAPLGQNDAQGYDYANSFDFGQAPTAGRVWPKEQPIPKSTMEQLAKLPPPDDEDDPT